VQIGVEMADVKMVTESFKVHGDEAVKKVRELVKEGNVRRISIANEDGDTLIELPLTVGVVGAALIPVAAAVGAVTAMLTECTITVVKEEPVDE
jgi:hypothetical protein